MNVKKYIDRSIMPLFVERDTAGGSHDKLMAKVKVATNAGIKSFMLFECSNENNLEKAFRPAKPVNAVAQAISEIKRTNTDLTLIADVCVCSMTTSAHCRISSDEKIKAVNDDLQFDEDKTLASITEQAIDAARAGVDMVSLSAMIEGQTPIIRRSLDDSGFKNVKIISVVKIASKYYDVARGIINPGTKGRHVLKPYHLPIDGSQKIIEWGVREAGEGADILMVKPGLSSLDIIYQLKSMLKIPIYAYVTTGKYRILRAGIESLGTGDAAVGIGDGIGGKEISGSEGAEFYEEEFEALYRAGADMVVAGMVEVLIDHRLR